MTAQTGTGNLPYPRNEKEFAVFLEAYCEKRDRNIARNTKEGISLSLSGLTAFHYLQPDLYPVPNPDNLIHNTLDSNLELPRLPRMSWASSIRPLESKVNLIRNLTPLIGRRAQIWVATVDEHQETVIVKIYQDCLVEEPWWSGMDNTLEEYWSIEEISHREAWAFGTLAELQGSLIPHSYGFYNVSPRRNVTSVRRCTYSFFRLHCLPVIHPVSTF
jgi:hypothetical protein